MCNSYYTDIVNTSVPTRSLLSTLVYIHAYKYNISVMHVQVLCSLHPCIYSCSEDLEVMPYEIMHELVFPCGHASHLLCLCLMLRLVYQLIVYPLL